ncbi:MAG: hypothetical protein U0169_24520 [Polyangiaceae bacterium]
MRNRFAHLLEVSDSAPANDRILTTTFWQTSAPRSGSAVVDLDTWRKERARTNAP